jgi:hypothetical protein
LQNPAILKWSEKTGKPIIKSHDGARVNLFLTIRWKRESSQRLYQKEPCLINKNIADELQVSRKA